MIEGKQLAGTAEGGNDFVSDEQHFVLIADFTDARKIVVRRYDDAARSLHRFGDEHRDGFRSLREDLFFQFVGGIAMPSELPSAGSG